MTPTPDLDHVLEAAARARRPARQASPAARAGWLHAIAGGLDDAADELVALAARETRLTEARLRGELARTSFQARLFADRLESGSLLDVRIDHADPAWPMGPRPDLRRTHVAIGPVLVFAASNFPFAFSVAGGDSVSALAVGCPVVVKAHDGHPVLSRTTASLVADRLAAAGAPDGVFGLIEGQDDGTMAARDPRIKAIGFTGSPAAGRALFDVAASRPDPIPFYGELGATNPVLVTREGWAKRSDEIAAGFLESCLQGSGQFCTQPGVVLVPDLDDFVTRLDLPAVGPMLNPRIADGFDTAVREVVRKTGVVVAASGPQSGDGPQARILTATAAEALADPSIVTTEMFGPASVVVSYVSDDEALAVLASVDGTLTATVHGADDLDAQAEAAIDLLVDRSGRIIWNQWPTGVTVSDAQHHGGPWPATTAPTTTSVGTAAAQRFVRPVAFQNLPLDGLPPELRP